MVTQARLDLNEYSMRVLDVFKGKHGLKNRNEALNKFIAEYGENYIEPEFDETYLKHLDNIVAEHEAKYGIGKRKMTDKELKKLLGLDNK